MTVQHSTEIALNAPWRIAVMWTRDNVPVTLSAASFGITQGSTTISANLGEGIEQAGSWIIVNVPRSSLQVLVPGAAQYDLVVTDDDGTIERLIAGSAAIVKGSAP